MLTVPDPYWCLLKERGEEIGERVYGFLFQPDCNKRVMLFEGIWERIRMIVVGSFLLFLKVDDINDSFEILLWFKKIAH